MTRLRIDIKLPEALARQAKESGLLEPDVVGEMVRDALNAKQVAGLARLREVLAADPLPPMTSEEIQAEIQACRAEVRDADCS